VLAQSKELDPELGPKDFLPEGLLHRAKNCSGPLRPQDSISYAKSRAASPLIRRGQRANLRRENHLQRRLDLRKIFKFIPCARALWPQIGGNFGPGN